MTDLKTSKLMWFLDIFSLPDNIAKAVDKIAKPYDNIIGLSTMFAKNVIPTVAGKIGQMAITDVVRIISKNKFTRPIYGANAF